MLRWFDGFDTYLTADVALQYNIVGTGWTTVPSAGRFGSGALVNQLSGGSDPIVKFFDDQPTWIVGVAYKFSLSGKATLIVSFQDSGNAQVEFGMTSNNLLQITRNGTVLATGTTTLLTNTFYYLEFKATISTSIAAGACKIRIGGVDEVVAATGANTDQQASGVANRVLLWYDQFQVQNTYDDFYVCDGTGAQNFDFLGDMRVEDLIPSGQGYHTDYGFVGPGGVTALSAVSESTEDGDTSYVWSSTVGDKESYTFPPLSSAPSSIAGVQLTIVARKDDAGSRAVTPLFRHSGTDYLAVQQALPDSYTYLTHVIELNPATGVPWTGSDVNAIEAGFSTTQ